MQISPATIDHQRRAAHGTSAKRDRARNERSQPSRLRKWKKCAHDRAVNVPDRERTFSTCNAQTYAVKVTGELSELYAKSKILGIINGCYSTLDNHRDYRK